MSRVLESSRCALRCPFKRPTNRGNPKLESTKSEGFLSFFLTNEQTNNELQTACSSVSDESMDDCFIPMVAAATGLNEQMGPKDLCFSNRKVKTRELLAMQ